MDKNFIYHSSYRKVQYPEIVIGKNSKDFSNGIYCTRIKEQAEKESSKFVNPIVNVYSLEDISHLKVKDIIIWFIKNIN